MEDRQIIALYWQRNECAISESEQKYGGYCFTLAHHILQNDEDSEECVNDTWLHAWNAIPPQKPNRLRMFFAKITRRLSFDRYERNTAQKRGGGEIPLVLDELAECIAAEDDVQSAAEHKALEEFISRFVRSLSARDGNLFIRRYFFAESVREIAHRYSLTENNVTVILSRTRKRLKASLQQEGYFHEQK